MKKLVKISAMTIWVMMFFMTPAAMAVVMGEVQGLPFSEPGAMLLLGTSLIGAAGLCRKKVYRRF